MYYRYDTGLFKVTLLIFEQLFQPSLNKFQSFVLHSIVLAIGRVKSQEDFVLFYETIRNADFIICGRFKQQIKRSNKELFNNLIL